MASRTTKAGSSNGNERLDQILDLLNQQSARMNDLEQEVRRVGEVRQEAPRVEEQPDNQARIEEELEKDLKRIAPPNFDGKTIGDGAEAWLFFDKKMTEFQNLTQGSMSVTQYWKKFTNLLKYVPQYQMDERFYIQKFILGLRTHIGAEVDIHNPLTMVEVFEKATKQEQKLQQLGNLRKNENNRPNFGNRNFQRNHNSNNRQIRNLKRGPNTQEKGRANQDGNKKENNNTNARQNMDRGRSGGHPGPRDGCYNCGGSHYASNCTQRTPAQRGSYQQGAPQH
ncbi:uncharacterized protein LOC131858408 [Cryptomeria japonica]|uniref:uncharacterized protein LOC131858408 n=1 Tax=Cryptomeria japonica TaxID=3369 RepID=UPI0027DA0DAC|nr:uncharacterized protein LOC131858408 [Cryptomeria japonica]